MRRTRWLVIFMGLSVLPALAMARQHALVKAETLTLRETASTRAKALATLVTHQPVEIFERRGNEWTKVGTLDGKQGWVLSRYLSGNGFVYPRLDKVNVRRGPGSEYATILNYGRNFPLRVLDIAPNGWLLAMDYEGDKGWLHPNIVQTEPQYVITRLPQCNIREAAGTDSPIKFTAEQGVILRVLEEKDGWLRVRHGDGDEGWISARIVFGYLDEVDPGAAMFPDEKKAAAEKKDDNAG
jgi:SH3-like domain-containing protein